jgi:hypothetical protein
VNVHGTSFDHPVFLQIASVTVNSPHFPCGADDSTPQLASASGKEGARSDQRRRGPQSNSSPLHSTPLWRLYAARANRRFLERRGEVKFSSNPLRHYIDLRIRGGEECVEVC